MDRRFTILHHVTEEAKVFALTFESPRDVASESSLDGASSQFSQVVDAIVVS